MHGSGGARLRHTWVPNVTGTTLNLFVNEHAQNDADEGHEVHLKCETDSKCQKAQINRDGRIQPGMDGLRKDVLNNAGGSDRQ